MNNVWTRWSGLVVLVSALSACGADANGVDGTPADERSALPCRSTFEPLALTGQLVERRAEDANGREESFFAIIVAAPVCASVDAIDGPAARRVEATELQLIVSADDRARLRGALAQEVTLRGVLVEGWSAHHHTPLLFEVASDASADVGREDDESRVTLAGPFRVVDFMHQRVAALSAAEARAFVGRSATFLGSLDTPFASCDEPSYRRRELPVDAYLEDSLLPPAGLERWGLDRGSVLEWTIACPHEDLVVVVTYTGHLLVGRDGVTFVLELADP